MGFLGGIGGLFVDAIKVVFEWRNQPLCSKIMVVVNAIRWWNTGGLERWILGVFLVAWVGRVNSIFLRRQYVHC